LTYAFNQNPFLGTKVQFLPDSQEFPGISEIPGKGWDSQKFFWYQGRTLEEFLLSRLPKGWHKRKTGKAKKFYIPKKL